MNLFVSMLLVFAQQCNCPMPTFPPMVACGTCEFNNEKLLTGCATECLSKYQAANAQACSNYCRKQAYAYGAFDATMNGVQAQYDACVLAGGTDCQAVADATIATATEDLQNALNDAATDIANEYASASQAFASCESSCCVLCNPYY